MRSKTIAAAKIASEGNWDDECVKGGKTSRCEVGESPIELTVLLDDRFECAVLQASLLDENLTVFLEDPRGDFRVTEVTQAQGMFL
jgi:hypothetical protein